MFPPRNIFVARDGGHLDDIPNMARLLFSKSGAV
jgi:hypothetical protein